VLAWTANYSYPDISLDENFDHAEIGLSIRQKGLTHLAIDLFKLKFEPTLTYNNLSIETPNMVFLRAMIIQKNFYQKLKFLENFGVTFLNDIDAHYLSSNKILMTRKLEADKIAIPKTLLIKIPFDEIDIERIGDVIGWPCVTKWMHGYANIGVEICESAGDLFRIVRKRNEIAKIHRLNETAFDIIIVQKLIRRQPVIQIHCVDDIAHAVIQFHQSDTSFKSNLRKDVITLPYRVDYQMKNLAVSALKSLGLDSARMDIMIDNGEYKICEINPQASHGWVTMTHLKNISDILVDHLYRKFQSTHQRLPLSAS